MKCEWPGINCPNEVMARIGLPSSNAIWVCREHFDQWGSGIEQRPTTPRSEKEQAPEAFDR